MSTELTPQQNFEQKIIKKLRTNIGSLMPDEVLAQVVRAAMEKLFFQDVEADRYSGRNAQESWFKKEVRAVMSERIQVMLRQWATEHEAEMKKMISDVFDKTPAEFLAKAINDMLAKPLAEMNNQLSQVMYKNNLQY